jgi:DNA-binding transcriptional regulator YdaS (Cro superfamily)
MGRVTGKKLLSTYLSRLDLSYAAFARLVGADRARIQRCATGKRSPGLQLALAIERETEGQVPASAWARRSSRKQGGKRVLRKSSAPHIQQRST